MSCNFSGHCVASEVKQTLLVREVYHEITSWFDDGLRAAMTKTFVHDCHEVEILCIRQLPHYQLFCVCCIQVHG